MDSVRLVKGLIIKKLKITVMKNSYCNKLVFEFFKKQRNNEKYTGFIWYIKKQKLYIFEDNIIKYITILKRI